VAGACAFAGVLGGAKPAAARNFNKYRLEFRLGGRDACKGGRGEWSHPPGLEKRVGDGRNAFTGPLAVV